jgi:hypothetical protein
MRTLRADADHDHVPVAMFLHAMAILRLCPDLEAPIMAGSMTIAEAQPAMRQALIALVKESAA